MFSDPQLLFLRAVLQKRIQQIADIILLLHRLQKTGVHGFLRCFGCVAHLPLAEKMEVVRQNPKGMVPALLKLLRLGFLPDIVPPGRGLTVINKAKILRQLLGGFLWGQVVEPGGQVDHIASCPAAEAVEIFLIQLHAGIFVIVKGAAGHAVPSDLNPISFCGFFDRNGLLDRLKYICAHRQSDFDLGMGGLYPAALARSLAALRRWLLYGSRTDTQRLGTVKLCLSFLQTCSGCFWERRVSFSISFRSWV